MILKYKFCGIFGISLFGDKIPIRINDKTLLPEFWRFVLKEEKIGKHNSKYYCLVNFIILIYVITKLTLLVKHKEVGKWLKVRKDYRDEIF